MGGRGDGPRGLDVGSGRKQMAGQGRDAIERRRIDRRSVFGNRPEQPADLFVIAVVGRFSGQRLAAGYAGNKGKGTTGTRIPGSQPRLPFEDVSSVS